MPGITSVTTNIRNPRINRKNNNIVNLNLSYLKQYCEQDTLTASRAYEIIFTHLAKDGGSDFQTPINHAQMCALCIIAFTLEKKFQARMLNTPETVFLKGPHKPPSSIDIYYIVTFIEQNQNDERNLLEAAIEFFGNENLNEQYSPAIAEFIFNGEGAKAFQSIVNKCNETITFGNEDINVAEIRGILHSYTEEGVITEAKFDIVLNETFVGYTEIDIQNYKSLCKPIYLILSREMFPNFLEGQYARSTSIDIEHAIKFQLQQRFNLIGDKVIQYSKEEVEKYKELLAKYKLDTIDNALI